MERYFWMLIGAFLMAVGVWLMFDFLLEFAKLVVGMIFFMIGMSFFSFRRAARFTAR